MQVRKQVRTRHGTTDWFQIGKVVCQGYMLSPHLFNLYAEYLMRNAGLEETQAGIKIARRNIKRITASFSLERISSLSTLVESGVRAMAPLK